VFYLGFLGGQGVTLMNMFGHVLSKEQVFDLDKQAPNEILEKFKDRKNLHILVCGGDGTVGWVLSAIDSIGFTSPPPVFFFLSQFRFFWFLF